MNDHAVVWLAIALSLVLDWIYKVGTFAATEGK